MEEGEDEDELEDEESSQSRKSSGTASTAMSKEEKAKKKLRDRKIRRALKKFDKNFHENLAMEKDVILPVLKYLKRGELLNCMAVARSWNGTFLCLGSVRFANNEII